MTNQNDCSVLTPLKSYCPQQHRRVIKAGAGGLTLIGHQQRLAAVHFDVDHVAGVPPRRDGRLARELEVRVERGAEAADVDVAARKSSSHHMTCSPTQPEMVSETLRLPLRAVVASSSAMRSSRSAQQLPPRSAADALPAESPPTSRPAATRAPKLYFVIDLLPSAYFLMATPRTSAAYSLQTPCNFERLHPHFERLHPRRSRDRITARVKD